MAKRVPPSFLQGILSLFSKMTPEWLTNLIDKTKGADEYVKKITEPYDAQKILRNKLDDYMTRVGKGEYLGKSAEEIKAIEDADTLSRLRLKDALAAGFTADDWVIARQAPGIHFLNFTDENPTVKIDDLWDLDFQQAKKLGYNLKEWQDAQDTKLLEKDAAGNFIGEENWELVPEHLRPLEHQTSEYSEAVKKQIKKEEENKIRKRMFTLIEGGKDDDLARGGIASLGKGGGFHKGLWESIMKLGTSMGISPKEQLKTFIELGIPITDKLKQKWGISEDIDIMQKQISNLTEKHPFLTEDKEFMELEKLKQQEIKKLKELMKQGDLFEKKNGGLISLVV